MTIRHATRTLRRAVDALRHSPTRAATERLRRTERALARALKTSRQEVTA